MSRVDERVCIHPQYESYDPIVEVQDLFVRIWNAVVSFFTWMIDAITDYYHAALEFFYPPQENLRNKLAPFQNMPRDPDAFLDRAYAIHEQLLEADKLTEFREAFEEMTNPSEIAFAIFRAYLFSNTHTNFLFFEYEDDGNNCNYSERMRALQTRFRSLADSDKIAIIDKTDFEGVRTMPISERAKGVLIEIHALANSIHQGHPNFLASFGALHRRVFP